MNGLLFPLLTDRATKLLLWGLVVHLVLDWLGQNHWMAVNKSRIYWRHAKGRTWHHYPIEIGVHPAGLVHALIHCFGLSLVFPGPAAFLIAALHYVIDLRLPLDLWRRFFKQTTEGPYAIHVQLWGDQVAHILVLAIFALILGK